MNILEEMRNDIACHESFERKDSDMVGVALGKFKRLIGIVEKQREAIKDAMKYAWHLEACMGIEGGTCTCGLDKRLVQWHETLLLTDTE